MQSIKQIFRFLSNKYIVSIAGFAVVMLLTDHDNLFEQYKRKKELNELLAKKQYYEQEIEKTKKNLLDLQNNADAIEKYARENYMMKRDNEDVFLFQPEAPVKK